MSTSRVFDSFVQKQTYFCKHRKLNFFGAARRLRRELPRGVWGDPPRGITQKHCFQCFWNRGKADVHSNSL